MEPCGTPYKISSQLAYSIVTSPYKPFQGITDHVHWKFCSKDMVKLVVWLAFLHSPLNLKLVAMATFSRFNQKYIQLILFLFKKDPNNCFLGRKQKIFTVTPREIAHKIHLSTSFDIPLKPKINFDVYNAL